MYEKDEELKELIIRAKNGDMIAKEKIVIRYERLLKKVVLKATGSLDEDVVAYCYKGILVAIDKYDETVNCSFTTFVYNRIRGVLSNDWANKTSQKRQILKHTISLETPLEGYGSDGRDTLLHETIEDKSDGYWGYKDLFTDETNNVLKAVGMLSESRQMIFGLKYLEGLTEKEIAEKLGLPKSKINYQIRLIRRTLGEIMGMDVEIPGIVSRKNQKRDRAHLVKEFALPKK